ncbi:uncharacterized protein BO80DRAFT_470445 [Aspergillus ibericus CBS 121593]|uniref:Uncharacterized protein n=1 Tax=Aspergillus ibericus CBS 121593 TaxID=1448316 RepID=A0A395HFU4_9EURO|nr:hypothetical protein BO80DRAFT_470445 [Aspergillus ibericus CBS 121593]RAL06343.1 hypothetical protein BO80DRAFT_470445 [Aspergillus ibericus CBS 121593]
MAFCVVLLIFVTILDRFSEWPMLLGSRTYQVDADVRRDNNLFDPLACLKPPMRLDDFNLHQHKGSILRDKPVNPRVALSPGAIPTGVAASQITARTAWRVRNLIPPTSTSLADPPYSSWTRNSPGPGDLRIAWVK